MRHRFFFSEVQPINQVTSGLDVTGRTAYFRQTANRIFNFLSELLYRNACSLQQRLGRPVFIAQKGAQQMDVFHDLVVVSQCNGLGVSQSLLEFCR